jgi:hypothetical protein
MAAVKTTQMYDGRFAIVIRRCKRSTLFISVPVWTFSVRKVLVSCYKTLLHFYQTAWCHVSEDSSLHIPTHGTLRSHFINGKNPICFCSPPPQHSPSNPSVSLPLFLWRGLGSEIFYVERKFSCKMPVIVVLPYLEWFENFSKSPYRIWKSVKRFANLYMWAGRRPEDREVGSFFKYFFANAPRRLLK